MRLRVEVAAGAWPLWWPAGELEHPAECHERRGIWPGCVRGRLLNENRSSGGNSGFVVGHM